MRIAIVLAATAASAVVPAAWAQTAPVGPQAEASAAFDQALQLVDQQDWPGALAAFQQAYSLVPNPTVLVNIGVCHMMLQQYPEAAEAFAKYRREGGANITPEDRTQVEGYLADLAPYVATVVINVDTPGVTVQVDGVSRGIAPLVDPLVLSIGDHLITASASGQAPVEQRIQLAAGDYRVVDIHRPSGPSLLRPAGIPTGPGASLLLGVNLCIKRGDANCSGVDLSFGAAVGLLWRFIPYLAADAEFFYGMSTTSVGGVSGPYDLGVLFGPRGFLPLGPVDLSATVAVGWAQTRTVQAPSWYELLGPSAAVGTARGFAMMVSVAAEYRIARFVAAGVEFRYHIPFYESCGQLVEFPGWTTCDTLQAVGPLHAADTIIVGAHATFYFAPDYWNW